MAAVEPSLERLAQLPALGFYVFAGSGTDYTARLFAPAAGITEDMVRLSVGLEDVADIKADFDTGFRAAQRVAKG